MTNLALATPNPGILLGPSPRYSCMLAIEQKAFQATVAGSQVCQAEPFSEQANQPDVAYYCWKLSPLHVYFSVLNWLFPERVGKKYKARYCVPLNGEYVIDVDSHIVIWKHDHRVSDEWSVCEPCLQHSKELTLQLCQVIEKYYRRPAIVFSGRMGFHVHVLDFDYRDWVPFRQKNPIWCHHASRFKFTKLLQKQAHVFDRTHFTVSVDPMRVVTVPNTLNATTGLVCTFIGSRQDSEKLTIPGLLERSKEYSKFHGYPEALDGSRLSQGSIGPVKSCAKNRAEAA